MSKIRKSDTTPYMVGLIFILVANVCFFNVEKLTYLFLCTSIGMILIFGSSTLKKSHKLKIEPGVKYLTVIYAMIFFNGFFRNRYGEFNWDAILFNYVEYIALYIAFRKLLFADEGNNRVGKSILISAVIISGYILIMESSIIIDGATRIGNSLSGNVNSVGVSLGIISLFLTYYFLRSNNKKVLLVLVVAVVLMLLTGSKKTVVYLGLDLFMFLISAKGKKRYQHFMIIVLVAIGLYYIVMNVSMFYEVIGIRIEDMITQLFGNPFVTVSHSTKEREKMIQEGFKIFLNHPIFGGGEKYFGSQTTSIYAYSHCNYTEILCNFGIFGLLIYYFPYLYKMREIIKCKWMQMKEKSFLFILVLAMLITDWMMVSYTDYVTYIPIIFVFAFITVEKSKRRSRNVQDKNNKKTMEA